MTRARIDVIRRKRDATQRFLKRDVSDLLANGLDINAFGRVNCCVWFLFYRRVCFLAIYVS